MLKGDSLQCGTDNLVSILSCRPPLRGDLKTGLHHGHNLLGTVFRRLQTGTHNQTAWMQSLLDKAESERMASAHLPGASPASELTAKATTQAASHRLAWRSLSCPRMGTSPVINSCNKMPKLQEWQW